MFRAYVKAASSSTELSCLDADKHNRQEFSCGVSELDVFLQQKARKESPEFSRTFVITSAGKPEQILGYYSLSSTQLRSDDLPEIVRKRLTPDTKLCRRPGWEGLAVDTRFQKTDLRLGELLLMDAQLRAWTAAQNVASFGLIVKVLCKWQRQPWTGFYRRYGFIVCEQTAGLMYLPLRTIEQTLKSAALI